MTKEEKLIKFVTDDIAHKTRVDLIKHYSYDAFRIYFPYHKGGSSAVTIKVQSKSITEGSFYRKKSVPMAFARYLNDIYGFDYEVNRRYFTIAEDLPDGLLGLYNLFRRKVYVRLLTMIDD
jgi:hypothetical protein